MKRAAAGRTLIALAALAAAILPPARIEGAIAAPRRMVAPGFHVRSVEGAWLDLAELLRRGPVLIDFWATWCKPCLAAMPELEMLHERYGPRGLAVIGISIDGPRNVAKVRPFANRLGLKFPIAVDLDGSLEESYQVRAAPTTFLIARDGSVVAVRQGYRPGETAKLAATIESLLEGARSDSVSHVGSDATGAAADSLGNESAPSDSASDHP